MNDSQCVSNRDINYYSLVIFDKLKEEFGINKLNLLSIDIDGLTKDDIDEYIIIDTNTINILKQLSSNSLVSGMLNLDNLMEDYGFFDYGFFNELPDINFYNIEWDSKYSTQIKQFVILFKTIQKLVNLISLISKQNKIKEIIKGSIEKNKNKTLTELNNIKKIQLKYYSENDPYTKGIDYLIKEKLK